MKLSRLIAGIDGIEVLNFSETEILEIKIHSKDVKGGTLFFALRGHKKKGEKYIEDAKKQGAQAVAVSREFSDKNKCKNLIVCENSRKTLAELCAKMSGNPEKQLSFIGITGTKGKTTTAFFISELLKKSGVPNVFIGTGCSVFQRSFINTTPDPTELFPLLSEVKKNGIKTVVLELSSTALKDLRVFGIKIKTGVFCGIGCDHIGKYEHSDFSDYLMSKHLLFTDYGVNVAIANADDSNTDRVVCPVKKVLRVGVGASADYRIENFSDGFSGSCFTLSGVPVALSLPGLYNSYNASLALVCVSEFLGVPVFRFANKIKDIHPNGRFMYYNINGVDTVVDYAHNSDSFKNILTLARKLSHGKVVCVFGSVGGRGFSRRRELAEVSESLADISVITSDDPNFEDPLNICNEILSYFKDRSRAIIIANRIKAIEYAVSTANMGDCVLILGKGGEKYMKINGKSIFHSDENTVITFLNNELKRR